MANKISIIKGAGGLGRPLPGEDFISGLVFYMPTASPAFALPSGFSTTDRIKEIFSVTDAEALGITDTHIGETKATSTITVSGGGTAGDTVNLSFEGTALGTYTSTGSSASTMAAGLVTMINAGTATHGYTAVIGSPTTTVTVTAPAGTGVYLNTKAISIVTSGTASVAAGNFSGGVASKIDILHYHISEYFRVQPKGDLFVGIYEASTDLAETVLVQNYAQGRIRQMGVYTQSAFSTSLVNAFQTQITTSETNYKPFEGVFQGDFSGTSDLTTLTDLHTLSASNVSVTVGQDGGNVGLALWKATGKSIGTVGVTLGAISLAKVSDSIAWVGKFDMASSELDTLAFANGTLYNSLSDGTIDNIDSKGYIFLKKHVGLGGSYFDNPYTAIALTSDYCYIQNNRTISKASRGLRTSLLPALASPVKVNADGTLSEDVVAYFKSLCDQALDIMMQNQELSAYAVVINPKQNVLSTSQIKITIALVPIGSANEIIVNIGYTVAIS